MLRRQRPPRPDVNAREGVGVRPGTVDSVIPTTTGKKERGEAEARHRLRGR